MRTTLAIMAALLSSPVQAQELSLVCEGGNQGQHETGRTSGVLSSGDGTLISGRVSSSQYTEIPMTALFRMKDGAAELNLPLAPTCGICKGEGGWRKVKDLVVSEDQITGRISYSLFVGSSTFEIDRRTGLMTSRNGFRGQCRAQDLTKRAF